MSTKTTKSKPRLGRGLSSLISVSELPVEVDVAEPRTVTPVQPIRFDDVPPLEQPPLAGAGEIPINSISPNPHQPRKQIDDAGIAELAVSIKSTGLIQPIIVRRAESGFQLIAGERRLRAARLAGLTAIPAIIRAVDSFTQAQMALVENIQREDLNPIDRAQSYRALSDQLGLTQAELAARLGEDRSSVANFLRLLELAEPVRDLVRQGKLTLGHAKVLAGVADILEQQRLAEVVCAQELSVRNLERMVQDRPVEPPPARRAAGTAHLLDLEKTISRELGMRAQIRSGKNGKGRLTLHYASLDQFDQLLAKLGVTPE
jgi:ParB family chromosome partitioning protein